MALRNRTPLALGSSSWISAERKDVQQFVDQEVEEFEFSAKNEIDWLNEHMAEIFTNGELNVTQIFKTPKKLRGKTPRTARKRDPLETRPPLTDIFSANVQSATSPSHQSRFYKQAATFQISSDVENQGVATRQDDANTSSQPSKINTDSGYLGMTEDEMEVDVIITESMAKSVQVATMVESQETTSTEPVDEDMVDERRTTEGSFHSAREQQPAAQNAKEGFQPKAVVSDAGNLSRIPAPSPKKGIHKQLPPLPSHASSKASKNVEILGKDDSIEDSSRPQSEDSSPVRPVIRKSSLNFASLPAREPLTTKKSIGAGAVHDEQSKFNRSSYFGKSSLGKSLGGPYRSEEDEDDDDTVHREESEAERVKKLQNKASTKSLQDKISMLGQSHPPRPTKSIPSIHAAPTNPTYPDLTLASREPSAATEKSNWTVLGSPDDDDDDEDEEDDDWIAPPPTTNINRPQLPKSHSTDVMEQISGKDSIGNLEKEVRRYGAEAPARLESPLRQMVAPERTMTGKGHMKAASTSRLASPSRKLKFNASENIPTFPERNESTTPAGSPNRLLYQDVALSASKSKLSSILKSARGIFASSAGVSAQAKIDILSPPAARSRDVAPQLSFEEALAGTIEPRNSNLYPDLEKSIKDVSMKDRPLPSPPKATTRSTRASRERQQKELYSENEKEKQKTAAFEEEKERLAAQERQYLAQKEAEKAQKARATEEATNLSKSQMGPPQIPKPGLAKRPTRPIKNVGPAQRPQPVSIRVGVESVRRLNSSKIGHPSNTQIASNLQESLAPPNNSSAPMPRPGLTKQASNASLKSSMSSNTAKPKALEVAARKKEADEREIQRKLDHKREIERELERKRAAQAEEDRRQELQVKKENERQQREKSAQAEERARTQKQALERKKAELLAKKEHLKNPAPPRIKSATEPVNEKIQNQRNEFAGGRPVSRLNLVVETQQSSVRTISQVQSGLAKQSLKRTLPTETEEQHIRPQPTNTALYQQQESKRRRTNSEEPEEQPRNAQPPRSNFAAPPVRNSTAANKPLMFSKSGYANAINTVAHPNPNLLKAVTNGQFQNAHPKPVVAHPNDMAKYTSAAIPFAPAPNPPGTQLHKTPARPGSSAIASAPLTGKSTPGYREGDNIPLPEIATDSEDEDSDAETFIRPDWANSPDIRRALEEQERGIDPELVFGPPAPLVMEEIFRNKDRMNKFRNRTSSANWSQDRLTREEVLADREARERVRREGGWRFGI